MLLRRQRTYCVTLSPKNPCEFFGHFFPHSWEFLVQIFRTYYAFLSTTPEHTFIQWPATLTKLCHIMHDHSVHIICSNVHLRPQWPMLGRHSDAHPAYTPVRHGPIYLYPLQSFASVCCRVSIALRILARSNRLTSSTACLGCQVHTRNIAVENFARWLLLVLINLQSS